MDLNTRDDVTPPSNGTESQRTSDIKLDKAGRRIKAHRIIFNKGEDDGHKQVKEDSMKKTFNNFVEQHTLPLTEEQLDEIVTELQEVLGKDAKAGDWIHDFVHSDNPKFKGKSKEKRKQMALAAFYSKQRNEAYSGNPAKEGILAAGGGTPAERGAWAAKQEAKKKEDEKKEVKEELKGGQVKLDKNKNGKLDAEDFKKLRKEETVDESSEAWRKSEEDRVEREARKAVGPKDSATVDKIRAMLAAERKKKTEGVKESWDTMLAHVKKTGEASKTSTATKHDVKKTSTGTVYTKQRDADGMSKEFKRDPDQAKRGRGRPKKSSFGEAVEFLLALDEETFDSIMEEGFDVFMQQFEQLDEESKAALSHYAYVVADTK